MTLTRHINIAIAGILACTSLSAATVSVVNQIPESTTMPSTASSAASLLQQQTSQQTSSSAQKNGAGPALGKLPSSKGTEQKRPQRPKLEAKNPTLFPETPTYTFPGLLAKIGSGWIGSDYLYNLHRNIGVVVDVVEQPDYAVSIDKENLSEMVSEIFQEAELVPEALATENTPPLPFFHILIFAFPTKEGSVAFVSGRLFEDALLARYGLDPIGTWQAITWEKQDLVVTSSIQFEEQLKKSVENIARTFVDRVEMYAKIKEEAESNAKLYHPQAICAPSERYRRKSPAAQKYARERYTGRYSNQSTAAPSNEISFDD